ncbi:MAG: hypothetical protein ACOYON_03195 [Fimbriimonas sp.]
MKFVKGYLLFWLGLLFFAFSDGKNGGLLWSGVGIVCWCIPGFALWFRAKETLQALARSAVMAVLGGTVAVLCTGPYSETPSRVLLIVAAVFAYRLFEGEMLRVTSLPEVSSPEPIVTRQQEA